MSVPKEEIVKKDKPKLHQIDRGKEKEIHLRATAARREIITNEHPIVEARPVIFSVSPAEKEVKVKAEEVSTKLHLWLR